MLATTTTFQSLIASAWSTGAQPLMRQGVSARRAGEHQAAFVAGIVCNQARARPGRRHCSVQVRHRLVPPKAAMTRQGGAGRWVIPVLRMATIGVYGFDGESFLERLRRANVGLLLDVRQRRGVRGSQYAWANSRRLQTALAHAGSSTPRMTVAESANARAASSLPSTSAATPLRSSTLPTSRRSCRPVEQWDRSAALCRARP